jgi:hypothetical protein
MLMAAALVLTPLTAGANPISVEVVRLRQVPGTHHVQLTYGVDGSTPATPSATKRDSTGLNVTWQGMNDTYTANTGSGLVDIKATQTCDCNVPVGQHKYTVTVKSAMDNKDADLTAQLEVVDNLGAPTDAGVPGGDMMPWDIPEPGEIQGLDCQVVCNNPPGDGPVNTDGPAVSTDGPMAQDAGTTSPDSAAPPKDKDDDDGGCSLGGSGGPLSLSLLVLLGLGLALRRR